VVDTNGFPQVNLGGIYDQARKGLVEETYNNAAQAGFGSLRAGPYVSSLNQNIGALQAQMENKAADLSEAESGRRLQQTMQGAELHSRSTIQMATLAAQKEQLGMQLSSQEALALQSVTEQGRQYDLGLGQRSAEFGANMAFNQQQAEQQAYQNYLAWLYGGANSTTDATGRVVPGGYATGGGGSPFSQLIGPVMGGLGAAGGMKLFG